MRKDLKRSITIQGHRTSLSLEDEFWHELQALAAARKVPLATLISEIDRGRGPRNLSSAIRVHILRQLKADHG